MLPSSGGRVHPGVLLGAGVGAGFIAAALAFSRSRGKSVGVSGGAGGGAVASDAPLSTTSSAHTGAVYETERAVQEYLLFHFAADAAVLPYSLSEGGAAAVPPGARRFAQRTAALALSLARSSGAAGGELAALDVGCAVGGSTFALSSAARAVGVDFSARFIEAAEALRRGGSLPFSYTVEGELLAAGLAALPTDARAERCHFLQGDACALPAAVRAAGPYHVVHAANLLCRLPDPARFLAQLPQLVAAGGIVLFVSPYSWLPAYTPRAAWLGGKADAAGAPIWSSDRLQAAMRELGFELFHEENVPFLIREHARKFQWGCSHATAFRWARGGGSAIKAAGGVV